MKLMRWALMGLSGIAGALALFVGWIYLASEAYFRSFPAPPAFTLPIPDGDADAIARGERIAHTRGCYGCHGEALQGRIMWGVVETPNLAHLARERSPSELEAAIRHGLGGGGRALYAMPSYNFARMNDEDVAALIAFLRAAPVSDGPPAGQRRPFPQAWLDEMFIRFQLARGADAAMPAWLQHVPELAEQQNPDPRIALGEYLAMTSCNECHGFDLRAFQPWGGESAPDLIVMAAYGEADFIRLMREGVPSSGAELEMMGPVARARFAHWTDEEVGALYAFLSAFAQRSLEQEH